MTYQSGLQVGHYRVYTRDKVAAASSACAQIQRMYARAHASLCARHRDPLTCTFSSVDSGALKHLPVSVPAEPALREPPVFGIQGRIPNDFPKSSNPVLKSCRPTLGLGIIRLPMLFHSFGIVSLLSLEASFA